MTIRRFDLERRFFVQAVSVDDVRDLAAADPNFTNSLKLFGQLIRIGVELLNMLEDAIASALANVEGLTVARMSKR